MGQYFRIHAENPQARLINQAVALIRRGGVVVYPTDSSYALGCQIDSHTALERICRIRQLNLDHNFTLVCRDLSELGNYARVENPSYRLIRALTPGPYTFILKASREVPRRLQNPKRKTIGLRVPDHPVAQALLEALGEPLMSTTLVLPHQDLPLTDPGDIIEGLGKQVDLVIDAGVGGIESTTMVDLVDGVPLVVRQGLGPVDGTALSPVAAERSS